MEAAAVQDDRFDRRSKSARLSRIADAHVHIWDRGRNEYPWLTPDLPDLYRDFAIEDLLCETTQVDALVLVEAAGTIDETTWLLDIANQAPLPVAVIGAIEQQGSAAAIEGAIEMLTQLGRFAGVRAVAERGLDDFQLRLLRTHGLVFELLGRSSSVLQQALAAARLADGLQIVVDHLGAPDAGDFVEWSQALEELEATPNISIKLSGVGAATARGVDINRCFSECMRTVGSGRLIFGSDWPVLLQHGTYEREIASVDTLLRDISVNERVDILYANACRIYSLPVLEDSTMRDGATEQWTR